MGIRLTIAVALLALTACTENPEPANPSGPAVCSGGVLNPAAGVEQVTVIGSIPSSIRRAGDEIWIVESGDNTVSRFVPSTGRYETVVDVGNGRGPYDVWIGEDRLWITNYVSNTVTVADRATGDVLVEIEHESFDGPSGIAVLDGRAYVGNVEFRGDGFGTGSITVIDVDDYRVFGSLQTKRQNPQALDVVDGKLVIVESGAYANDGTFIVGSEGAIEVWEPTADPLIPHTRIAMMPRVEDDAVGLPGRPAQQPGSNIIYLPSGTGAVVFSFDVDQVRWVRGSDNPIRLYDTTENALHHLAFDDDGVLYVTAFNEDKLYLVDTACDAVLDEIELEPTSMLAGPHGVVPFGDAAYFILEFSHELGKVTFDW